MLQQTTVAAVAARYDGFLARFPNLPALARARESSVLAAWSGLGYYARARNLHAAARRIVSAHEGRVPRDPATLATLPGFGDYMSAAVASLAFGARVPALDANVTRVVSRLFAVEGEAGTRVHTELLRRHAGALLPERNPGDVTAALMDLGQQICTARHPDCPACPVARSCAARAAGSPERFPLRRAKPRARHVFQASAVAARAGRTLVVRAEGELLRRMWLFPSAEGATAGSGPRAPRAPTREARVAARFRYARRRGAPHHRSPASRDCRVSRGVRIARLFERCALAHTEGPRRGADSDSDAAHRRRGRVSASALTTVC